MMPIRIAIVADFNPQNESHVATDDSIDHCSAALALQAEHRWVATEEVAARDGKALAEFQGFWIGPASPYKSMDGALCAIRIAREQRRPLLGTCGGFQHMVLEYARNVLGLVDAAHEESDPGASQKIISRLACSLVGRKMRISLQPDSLVAGHYGQTSVEEQYRCNFGFNTDYMGLFSAGTLRSVGSDDEGIVRVVELADHPFCVGTLFLPQLNSSPSAPHPLISGFIRACAAAK
jgi:CTP synthase (UTP-ammonia lyase)